MLPNLAFLLSSIALLSNAAPLPLNNTSTSTSPLNNTSTSTSPLNNTSTSTSPLNNTSTPPFPLYNSSATPLAVNNTSSCDAANNLTSSNWECYNVDKFLASWWTEHGSECENQPFFYCFAAYYNTTYMLCDGIGSQCDPGELFSWKHGTEAYYVLVAIANVNQYFTDLYNAMSASIVIMNELLPNLSNELNAPHGGSKVWYKDLSSILIGIGWYVSAFRVHPDGKSLNAPAVWAITGFSDFNLDKNAVVDHQYVNFAKLSQQFAKITSDYQDTIAGNLHNTLYNYSNFSSMVANGTFLYGNYAGINTTEQAFKKLFESYIMDKLINIILRAKGIYVVMAETVNAHEASAPPGQWDTKSHIYWTDPNLKLTRDGKYTIWYFKSNNHIAEDNKSIDELLFESHGNLTSPEKVFRASWECQSRTGKKGGGYNNFDITHPVDLDDCLYNLPVCVANNREWGVRDRNLYINCPNFYDPTDT